MKGFCLFCGIIESQRQWNSFENSVGYNTNGLVSLTSSWIAAIFSSELLEEGSICVEVVWLTFKLVINQEVVFLVFECQAFFVCQVQNGQKARLHRDFLVLDSIHESLKCCVNLRKGVAGCLAFQINF